MPNQPEKKLKSPERSDVISSVEIGIQEVKEKAQELLAKTGEEVSRFLESLQGYKKEGADSSQKLDKLEIKVKNTQQLEQAQMEMLCQSEESASRSKKFNPQEFRRLAECTPLAKKLMQQ